MKKVIKIILAIGVIILALIELDTIQALAFNRSPLLHTREYTSFTDKSQYIDKGIFVNHYNFENNKETLFKSEKSKCIFEP